MDDDPVYKLRPEFQHLALADDFTLKPLPADTKSADYIEWRGTGRRACGRLYAEVERSNGTVFWVDITRNCKP